MVRTRRSTRAASNTPTTSPRAGSKADLSTPAKQVTAPKRRASKAAAPVDPHFSKSPSSVPSVPTSARSNRSNRSATRRSTRSTSRASSRASSTRSSSRASSTRATRKSTTRSSSASSASSASVDDSAADEEEPSSTSSQTQSTMSALLSPASRTIASLAAGLASVTSSLGVAFTPNTRAGPSGRSKARGTPAPSALDLSLLPASPDPGSNANPISPSISISSRSSFDESVLEEQPFECEDTDPLSPRSLARTLPDYSILATGATPRAPRQLDPPETPSHPHFTRYSEKVHHAYGSTTPAYGKGHRHHRHTPGVHHHHDHSHNHSSDVSNDHSATHSSILNLDDRVDDADLLGTYEDEDSDNILSDGVLSSPGAGVGGQLDFEDIGDEDEESSNLVDSSSGIEDSSGLVDSSSGMDTSTGAGAGVGGGDSGASDTGSSSGSSDESMAIGRGSDPPVTRRRSTRLAAKSAASPAVTVRSSAIPATSPRPATPKEAAKGPRDPLWKIIGRSYIGYVIMLFVTGIWAIGMGLYSLLLGIVYRDLWVQVAWSSRMRATVSSWTGPKVPGRQAPITTPGERATIFWALFFAFAVIATTTLWGNRDSLGESVAYTWNDVVFPIVEPAWRVVEPYWSSLVKAFDSFASWNKDPPTWSMPPPSSTGGSGSPGVAPQVQLDPAVLEGIILAAVRDPESSLGKEILKTVDSRVEAKAATLEPPTPPPVDIPVPEPVDENALAARITAQLSGILDSTALKAKQDAEALQAQLVDYRSELKKLEELSQGATGEFDASLKETLSAMDQYAARLAAVEADQKKTAESVAKVDSTIVTVAATVKTLEEEVAHAEPVKINDDKPAATPPPAPALPADLVKAAELEKLREHLMEQLSSTMATLDNKVAVVADDVAKAVSSPRSDMTDNDLQALAARLKAMMGNVDQGTAGSGSFDMDEIVAVVAEQISLWRDGDGIGRPDYALGTAGAWVVSERSTPCFAGTDESGAVITEECNQALSVLNPDNRPGMCWAFAGSKGQLVVALSEPVRVRAVTIDHIDDRVSRHPESAPRAFTVYGLSDVDADFSTAVKLGDFVFERAEGAGPGGGRPTLQTFDIDAESLENPDEAFKAVVFQFTQNHGHTAYTCVYRTRVHGEPRLGYDPTKH